MLYFQFRVHHLQFASSNFHSACSICSSHALFSFSRALFAVRVLYFQFRALHLQFVRSNFDSTCFICSSHALFSLLRALFSVRVLYFQFRVVYLQFACSICGLNSIFRVLHLQLACSGFLFTCSSCNSHVLIFSHFVLQLPALDRAIRALLFLHVILCCGLCMWHMNKVLRLKWLQHG